MFPRVIRSASVGLLAGALLLAFTASGTFAHGDVPGTAPLGVEEELDPIRNAPFPCDELEPALSLPARAEENLVHIANKCGLVGTDIEFQSRRVADGSIHDYAFVGSMGSGLRIFDVTDPTTIVGAGRYNVVGYQNEVQVSGNRALVTFDGLSGEPSNTSVCFQEKFGTNGQGVELIRLRFDRQTARFQTSLIDCLANPPGGAHNATFHPGGKWLAISNPSSDWAVDVMDLTKLGTSEDAHVLRLIDESRKESAGRCPAGASFTCIVMKRPPAGNLGSDTDEPACRPSACTTPDSASGLWRPHDVHFSRDGKTMYVAALNSTFIVNVNPVNRFIDGTIARPTRVPTISILDNLQGDDPADVGDPNNIELSHQADVSADGRILVISDEQGGGVSETGCQQDPESGVVGALHFWAVGKIGRPAIDAQDPTPANPVRLGIWVSPNPEFENLLPLVPDEGFLPTALRGRGCTVHVFRLGGDGTASPGPVDDRFDGVSRFTSRRLSTAFYGAGTLFMDFTRRTPADSAGGVTIEEDPATTWGITLGYNVQLGADTWSAKEYKGHIYTGDLIRGFDAFRITQFADPVVELDKTGPATAAAGSLVTYRLTYRNLGPADSGEARVSDPLPEGMRFASASDGGDFDAATRTVSWDLGTVSVGETDTLRLTVRIGPGVDAGTSLVNRATYTAVATVSPPTAIATTTVTSPDVR